MGMYDYFFDKCPHCGKDTQAQTKLFDCVLRGFAPGDPIRFPDAVFNVKENCEHCDKPLIAKIAGNKFIGFVKEEPTHEEGAWGRFGEIGKLPL